MNAARHPKHPHDTLYPRTRFFDQPPPPRNNGALIAVALLAAAVGVFALTRSPTEPGTRPDPATITEAVQEELHTMFLTDLDPEHTLLRSARTRSTHPTRLDGLRVDDTIAVRCHGKGKLHITLFPTTRNQESRSINCGQTALNYLVNEGSFRAVQMQVDSKEAWASWALLQPRGTGQPSQDSARRR